MGPSVKFIFAIKDAFSNEKNQTRGGGQRPEILNKKKIKFTNISIFPFHSWISVIWINCRQTTALASRWTWGCTSICSSSTPSSKPSQYMFIYNAIPLYLQWTSQQPVSSLNPSPLFSILLSCQGLLHFNRVGCDGGSSTEEWEILSMLWGT